jgi:hypothetical protein
MSCQQKNHQGNPSTKRRNTTIAYREKRRGIAYRNPMDSLLQVTKRDRDIPTRNHIRIATASITRTNAISQGKLIISLDANWRMKIVMNRTQHMSSRDRQGHHKNNEERHEYFHRISFLQPDDFLTLLLLKKLSLKKEIYPGTV